MGSYQIPTFDVSDIPEPVDVDSKQVFFDTRKLAGDSIGNTPETPEERRQIEADLQAVMVAHGYAGKFYIDQLTSDIEGDGLQVLDPPA